MPKFKKLYMPLLISAAILSIVDAYASAAADDEPLVPAASFASLPAVVAIFKPVQINAFVTKILDGSMSYSVTAQAHNATALQGILDIVLRNENMLAQQPPGAFTQLMAEYAAPSVLYCLYGCHEKDSGITAINMQSGERVDIAVGERPIFATLVGADLYALNARSKNVSVINTVTKTKFCQDISVGSGSYPCIATLIGNNLYILNQSGHSIPTIDIVTKKVGKDIGFGLGRCHFAIVVGTDLYVASGGDTIILDTTTDTAESFKGLAIEYATLVGTDLYALNARSNNVSIINTTTKTKVGADIKVGKKPFFATLGGTDLYVLNEESRSVSVINTTTKQKVGPDITIGGEPRFATLVGNYLYVPYDALTYEESYVLVIDIATKTRVGTDIKIGVYPRHVNLVDDNLAISCDDGMYLLDTGRVEASLRSVITATTTLATTTTTTTAVTPNSASSSTFLPASSSASSSTFSNGNNLKG